MSDDSIIWRQSFTDLFHPTVGKYRNGHAKAVGLVDAAGASFLKSIGYSEQEFFDFVEDFAKGGEPILETALRIAEVRREYFLRVQKGVMSDRRVETAHLPPKDAELDGIVWLPRIMAKAEAKLRGEMSPDLMYCCGGDRRFFATNHVEPAEFLRQTWEAQGDKQKIVRWVKAQEV